MLGRVEQLGAPVLREVAEQVELDDHTVSLVNRMKFFLTKVDGYGLAAPQIGYSKRIFVYNIGEGPQTIINPQLHEFSDEMWLYDEGCLSIPGYWFPIWRPKKVLLRGIDLDGNSIRLEAEDLLARLFQHEQDHLNGKLVIDLLTEDERKDFSKKWHVKNKNKKKKKKR